MTTTRIDTEIEKEIEERYAPGSPMQRALSTADKRKRTEPPRDVNDPQLVQDGHDSRPATKLYVVRLVDGTIMRITGYSRLKALLDADPLDEHARPVDIDVQWSNADKFKRLWFTYLRRSMIGSIEQVGR